MKRKRQSTAPDPGLSDRALRAVAQYFAGTSRVPNRGRENWGHARTLASLSGVTANTSRSLRAVAAEYATRRRQATAELRQMLRGTGIPGLPNNNPNPSRELRGDPSKLDRIAELLRLGADPNTYVKRYRQSTVLDLACTRQPKSLLLAKTALEFGADPNLRGALGRTPLIEAASGYDASIEIVKLLLDKGADIDSQDGSGATALIMALHRPPIVEYLLKRGADPRFVNHNGRTALDVAMRYAAYQSAAELLRKAMR